jgi:hypothetical protein
MLVGINSEAVCQKQGTVVNKSYSRSGVRNITWPLNSEIEKENIFLDMSISGVKFPSELNVLWFKQIEVVQPFPQRIVIENTVNR